MANSFQGITDARLRCDNCRPLDSRRHHRFLNYQAPAPGRTGQWVGHGAQIACSAAIWIALPLAIGTVRTIRREIR